MYGSLNQCGSLNKLVILGCVWQSETLEQPKTVLNKLDDSIYIQPFGSWKKCGCPQLCGILQVYDLAHVHCAHRSKLTVTAKNLCRKMRGSDCVLRDASPKTNYVS